MTFRLRALRELGAALGVGTSDGPAVRGEEVVDALAVGDDLVVGDAAGEEAVLSTHELDREGRPAAGLLVGVEDALPVSASYNPSSTSSSMMSATTRVNHVCECAPGGGCPARTGWR